MCALPSQPEWLMRACAVLLAGWLIVCAVAAAPSQIQFDHWTTDDGLPQNTIKAIRQTQDGYLWLATFDGLVRFDGLQFTVFNKGNTKGIGSNRFDQLFEDRHGTLWAVTDEDWLVKYQAGVFTTYTPQDGLPSGIIVRLEETSAGNLRVVAHQGIAEWRNGWVITCTIADLMPPQAADRGFEQNLLARLNADRLSVYRQGRVTSYSLQSGLPSLSIRSLFEDQHGVIWISTDDAGVVRLKDGRFTAYPVQAGTQLPFLATEDRRGNLWLSDAGSWLRRFSDGQLTQFNSAPIHGSSVQTFYEDREGNFWIGTNEGLYRARESAISALTRQDGLSSDNIYSIYEDRAGQLWFGTWGQGVTRYKDGCAIHYRMKGRVDADNITALYEDRDGRIWIGTATGVFRFDQPVAPGCRRSARLSALPAPADLFRGGVWAIHQDQAGRFWFGTNRGLLRYEAGRFTRYTTADGLAGDEIKAILEDRGALWIGTWGGLSRLAEGQFTSYTERDGLASNHIRTLYQDAEGTLWIGTYDGGLSRLRAGRLTSYTTKDGLFDNGVFQILEDEHGSFWMSCNRGIYRVRRQDLNDFAEGRIRAITTMAYSKEDGLLDAECNGGRQPAGWKARDGRLWFPTARGAAVIDPSRLELNQHPPPVVIEQCRLNNETVPAGEVVTIAPEQNGSLEIRYQGLSFIRPAQQRFRYRLTGIDPDWIEVGSRRAAYYSHLPPGSYTFTVLAANSDGIWNTRGASLHLEVLPSFWQTWWFSAGSVAAALTLILLAFERRQARFRREQALRDGYARQLIDAQERERQRMAGDLHDSAGQLVNLISHYALDGLATADDDELATRHFARIAALAGDAATELRLVAHNLRPPEIDRLGLTRALDALIDRFNRLSAIEFTCLLDQIDAAFDDDGRVHLYRIVQESLNNIISHSQADKAVVIIRREAGAVKIEISDNGEGCDLSGDDGARAGLGLSGITERARLLGGRAEIRSMPGQGTTVTVIITQPERQP